MQSGRLLLLLSWRAADHTHTLRAGRKAAGVRAPTPICRQFLGKEREGENVREKVAAVFRHRSSAPKLKSCIICASHLYKNCISKKPLPISVRILGSKMQVLRDLELQTSTKIWLLLKIQRCARNEFLQIQRCYSFLAIVGLRI